MTWSPASIFRVAIPLKVARPWRSLPRAEWLAKMASVSHPGWHPLGSPSFGSFDHVEVSNFGTCPSFWQFMAKLMVPRMRFVLGS